jgi:hypothetical protein
VVARPVGQTGGQSARRRGRVWKPLLAVNVEQGRAVVEETRSSKLSRGRLDEFLCREAARANHSPRNSARSMSAPPANHRPQFAIFQFTHDNSLIISMFFGGVLFSQGMIDRS